METSPQIITDKFRIYLATGKIFLGGDQKNNWFCINKEKVFIDGFHVVYYFDFYARQPDFLVVKNGSRQWKTLENLLLKKIANLLKKKSILLLLYYTVQKIPAVFNVITYHFYFLRSTLKKISFSPTSLDLFSSKIYYWCQSYIICEHWNPHTVIR